MKRFILVSLAALFVCSAVEAQILRADELEKLPLVAVGWVLWETSCKALVMAHAYSNVVMDKIEECIKNGLTGNENDNW